jgi:hypothetical protein
MSNIKPPMNEMMYTQIFNYLTSKGFTSEETIDTTDFFIDGQILILGLDLVLVQDKWFALDDTTNTRFSDLQGIRKFYNI